MSKKISLYAAMALSALLAASDTHGQTNIGQWDFKNGDLSATAGSDLGPLAYFDGPNGQTSNLTVFASTKTLGLPSIGGVVTNVMMFPGNSSLPIGYLMPTPPANGGGSLVNDYTIICDVLYTNDRVFRPILQMDNGEFDDIEAFFAVNQLDHVAVTNTHGAALPSGQFGTLQTNTWYRLAYVCDTDTGEISLYTNGVPAGTFSFGTGQIDSPYALYSGQLPCFSSDLTNEAGFVNSVQLRDTVLNAGQIAALGGPSPSGIPIVIPPVGTFVQSREPDVSEINILPTNAFNVVLNEGNTTVDPNSIELYLDGSLIPFSVVATAPTFTVTSAQTNILASGSVHTLGIAWSDSVNGAVTNSWQFTVYGYQTISLPAPFYLETFDEVAVGSLPNGWYVTNNTLVQDTNFDLCSPISASYENWQVLDSDPLCGTGICGGKGFECDTFNQGPIELNGSLIQNLGSNNFLYFESDNRQQFGKGQVGMVFSPDIDCTGQSNVYLCFNSMWMQNRNAFGSIEYSVDQGSNWLPALYCIADSPGNDGRIIYSNTIIDAEATFTNEYDDQAGPLQTSGPFSGVYAGSFAMFMAAPVNQADAAFIQAFPDDGYNYVTTGGGVTQSQWIGKEIEKLRLAGADGQSHVRFRIGYEGRCSWYWGIDNFGLYSINVPDITAVPESLEVNGNTSAAFTVSAVGAPPLSFQWQFDGTNIAGATGTSYVVPNTIAADDGSYTVVVSNAYGAVTSGPPAVLTVETLPDITNNPAGEIVDLGGTVTYVTGAGGAVPMSYLWYFGDTLLQNSTNPTLTVANIKFAQAGEYTVVASNVYGTDLSEPAFLDVWAGPITNNLVAHLPLNGDFSDTSGRGNNAAYLYNGPNSSTTPRFTNGFIHTNAFEFTTTEDYLTAEYASFGYPTDLQFGANTNFTISFWVKFASSNQDGDVPFISNKDWNSSSDPGWGIFSQTGGNYRINVTGPNLGADKYSETDTPHVLGSGTWHNVLVSFLRAPFGQSAFVYGYLDGVLASKHAMFVDGTIDTDDIPFSNEQGVSTVQGDVFAVNVGQDGTGVYCNQGSAYLINAAMDDLGIWRRALTANEAMGVYQAGLAGNDLTHAVSATLTAVVSGANLQISWNGSATVELETATDLGSGQWTVVNGTMGASSASVPLNSAKAAYFRLVQVQ